MMCCWNDGDCRSSLLALTCAVLVALYASANEVPWMTSNTDLMRAIIGEQTTALIYISDWDLNDTLIVYTYFIPATIPGTSLEFQSVTYSNNVTYTYLFRWTPQNLDSVAIRFRGNDTHIRTPTFYINYVSLCYCGHGQCNWNRAATGYKLSNQFSIVKCEPCESGYEGEFCNETLDWCAALPCDERPCILDSSSPAGYRCGPCPAGFTADGTKCMDNDECATTTTNNCTAPQQQCINTDGSYLCTCSDGYQSPPPGNNCTDIDECQLHTASCAQQCINTPGSYQCTCLSNYQLSPADNQTCILIPSTDVNDPCGLMLNASLCQNGFCAAINGSAICQCSSGYQYDSASQQCIDIDECSTNMAHCGDGSTCINNVGLYTCLCPAGMQLAADQRTCIDCFEGKFGENCSSPCQCAIDTPCNPVNGCSVCFNTGFTGGHCIIDVDECARTPDICGPHATCINIVGSYSCQCDAWYERVLDSCQILDACLYDVTRSNPRPPGSVLCNEPHGVCQANDTVPGAYSCTCTTGFSGDRCQIGVSACLSNPCKNYAICRDISAGVYSCQCLPYYIGLDCDIEVSTLSVTPLYGPLAGGTRITISGTGIVASSILSLYLGTQYRAIKSGSNSGDSATVISPPSDRAVSNLPVVIEFTNGYKLNTSFLFSYRNNPQPSDLQPRKHLTTGGTSFTVTGTSMNSVANPQVILMTVVTRSNGVVEQPVTSSSWCESSTDGGVSIVCRMPIVSVPSDIVKDRQTLTISDQSGPGVSRYTSPDTGDRFDLYLGLIFDAFSAYTNISSVQLPTSPVKIVFYPPPIIQCAEDIVPFDAPSAGVIKVKGSNMRQGCQLVDYAVTLDSGLCQSLSVTDTQLLCRPPTHRPALLSNSTCPSDHLAVTISVGSYQQNCPCLKYEVYQPSITLIIGLSVGVGGGAASIGIVLSLVLCLRAR